MDMQRRPRLRELPINRMIPNILTVLALCAGLTAIHFALLERWEATVIAIVVAGVLDGLDGRIARILGQTSKFGAELDSLSDFISFGVAPALVLYFWSLHDIGGMGWAVVVLFSVCCALRLARFNTALEAPDRPPWSGRFFQGVPAPAGAGLAIMPMLMSLALGTDTVFRSPALTAVVLIGVAALMVSQLPTFSLKSERIPRHFVLPILLAVGGAAGFMVTMPWGTLTAIGFLYLGSIPFSLRLYRRMRAQHRVPADEEDEGAFISVGDTDGDEADSPPALYHH